MDENFTKQDEIFLEIMARKLDCIGDDRLLEHSCKAVISALERKYKSLISKTNDKSNQRKQKQSSIS